MMINNNNNEYNDKYRQDAPAAMTEEKTEERKYAAGANNESTEKHKLFQYTAAGSNGRENKNSNSMPAAVINMQIMLTNDEEENSHILRRGSIVNMK